MQAGRQAGRQIGRHVGRQESRQTSSIIALAAAADTRDDEFIVKLLYKHIPLCHHRLVIILDDTLNATGSNILRQN